MADDRGLQAERTALAWVRTLLGAGAAAAVAVRHELPGADGPRWTLLAALGLAAAVLGLAAVGVARARRLVAGAGLAAHHRGVRATVGWLLVAQAGALACVVAPGS